MRTQGQMQAVTTVGRAVAQKTAASNHARAASCDATHAIAQFSTAHAPVRIYIPEIREQITTWMPRDLHDLAFGRAWGEVYALLP
jgi:hypothetical protein